MAFLNKLAKKELEKYAYTHRVIVGTSIGKTQITHGGAATSASSSDSTKGLDLMRVLRLGYRKEQDSQLVGVKA